MAKKKTTAKKKSATKKKAAAKRGSRGPSERDVLIDNVTELEMKVAHLEETNEKLQKENDELKRQVDWYHDRERRAV